MTAGLDRRWRRATAAAVVRPGDKVLDVCCGTGDLAVADAAVGGRSPASTSPRPCSSARGASRPRSSGCRRTRSPCRAADGSFDAATVGFGVRNLADLEAGLRELRRVLRPGGRLGVLEITQPQGALQPFFRVWFDRVVPFAGRVLPGGAAYTYLPGERAPLPRPRGSRAGHAGGRLRRGPLPPVRRRDRRAARRGGGMTRCGGAALRPGPARVDGLARGAPGRRGRPAGRRRRRRGCGGARRRRQAAAAAARLPHRAARRRRHRWPPGSRSSSCTWRASSTTTSSTAPASAVAARRPGRASGRRPPGRPATTSSRARSPSWRRPVTARRSPCSRTPCLCLARGEAMQRTQVHRADTTVAEYLERCALKTGKLFEAACVLGGGARNWRPSDSRSASPSRSPTTSSTARATHARPARSPAPTCARARRRCRCCSPPRRTTTSGGRSRAAALDGALVRVAAIGRSTRSRAPPSSTPSRPGRALDGHRPPVDLVALTYAVVDRQR